ncbi:MAG: hypothetical protein II067_00075 [Agathobacter sp.]|uniref:hypothetical protein n=1 Tax=Agathobacter sp. TaxID=2021311 RepID=UPI00257EC57B|nr:hypothetical protein [Agathobacter sp.]MBQ1680596.1 hypothetical protein [Agathobacter sp.]MCR5677117.1 FYDLN acid domain-containing protein [Agathobacter sp.]
MELTKTKLGINAGLLSAFILLTGVFPAGGAIILFAAVVYAGLIEENPIVKKAAKIAVVAYLIQLACTLLFDFIDYFVGLFSIETGLGYTTTMSKLKLVVAIAYLIVLVVFAIVYLVKGLPAAPAPVYTQMPQQAPQAAPQGTRTCPTCNTLLAGPGICPKCGTKVD